MDLLTKSTWATISIYIYLSHQLEFPEVRLADLPWCFMRTCFVVSQILKTWHYPCLLSEEIYSLTSYPVSPVIFKLTVDSYKQKIWHYPPQVGFNYCKPTKSICYLQLTLVYLGVDNNSKLIEIPFYSTGKETTGCR